MASRLANIVINAVDVPAVAGFWQQVLGWEVDEDDEAEDAGILCLVPHDRSGPGIDVVPVPEAGSTVNRLHLDLRADRTSTEAELERLLGLGARRVDVGQPADATWVVLADPEGNEFCLLSRTAQEAAGA